MKYGGFVCVYTYVREKKRRYNWLEKQWEKPELDLPASSCSCVDDAKARLEAAARQGGFADDDLRIREKRELDLSARAIAESLKRRDPWPTLLRGHLLAPQLPPPFSFHVLKPRRPQIQVTKITKIQVPKTSPDISISGPNLLFFLVSHKHVPCQLWH